MEEDAHLQLEMLSEADTRRSSSSSEGSLAALFYPPLPHDQAAARDAADTWCEIRHSDVSKASLTDSALRGMCPHTRSDNTLSASSCALLRSH